MFARAWHKKAPPAARPSIGSSISNKRRLKAVFCKNSVWGLLKFSKNKRLLLQKQRMILEGTDRQDLWVRPCFIQIVRGQKVLLGQMCQLPLPLICCSPVVIVDVK